MQTHSTFKYLLLLDGTVAAFRAPGLFLQDSLIFKEDSEYYEWWYPYLTADEHYLSITPNLSNLLDKLKWAKTNDSEAKLMAQKGSKLAQEILTPENVYCYYARALMMYSARQSRDVKLTDEHTYIQFDSEAPHHAKDKHGHCPETRHTEL